MSEKILFTDTLLKQKQAKTQTLKTLKKSLMQHLLTGKVMVDVKPRFDLFAEDTAHRVIVDIQHARTTDHDDRFLYYHCAALLEQIAKAEDYHPPLHVFTVVVLTSGDRHKTDIVVTDFDQRDLAGRPLGEIPHKIIYLCPKYVTETTPEPYWEWLQAINDTLDKEVDETQYHRTAILKLFERIQSGSDFSRRTRPDD
ncbi:MAG: hypothetical protein GY801_48875 [bacterium]|nr:hypothetical protein [bacterium]